MTRINSRQLDRSRRRTGDENRTNVTQIARRATSPKAACESATMLDSAARLWSIQEASQYLGVPANTLYQWRVTGYGPKAYKLGKHLRYTPADIRAWLETKVA